MSDLDEFMSANNPPADNQGGGSDLAHFLANIGEGAVHAIPDVAGFVGDVGHDLLQVGKQVIHPETDYSKDLALPGMGPASAAISKSFDKAEENYVQSGGQEVPKPKNDLEQFLNSLSRGAASGLIGGPEVAGRAILGGAAGGLASQGAYDVTGNKYAAYAAGLAAGGAPFIRGGHAASPVEAGMSHPDFNTLANTVVPSLEGGGTLENPKVNSSSGAMGPMQVTPETARNPGYGIRPWDGKSQADLARVGREKLAVLLHKYDGDPEKALAAYDWGEGNLDEAIAKHGEDWFYHMPAETQHYVMSGMMKLGVSGGSVGGPVPPMAPEDIASAMGEAEPASATELAPDDHQLVNIRDAINSHIGGVLDSHISEANRILDDYDTTGEVEEASPEQVESYRQGAEELLKGMPEDHPLRDKAQEAVNLWHEVQSQMDEDGIAQKPEIDALYPQGSDSVLGQEPVEAEPANDNVNQGDLTKKLYEHLTGQKAPENIKQEDMIEAVRTKLAGDDGAPRDGMGRAGGEPPNEPPFGGGGEPPKGEEPEGDKYAGSINLNRLAISNAAKENIKSMAAPMNMSIETFNETRQKAAALIDKKGVEGVLNQTTVAPQDLAHYATAVRAIHAAAQENMLHLNEQFLNPESNGDVAHVRWLHAKDVLASAFDANQKVAQGLGRGLGAMRIEVGGEDGNLGEKVSDLMKTRASDEEIARMIAEHPEMAGKIARDSKKPTASDYIFTTWYAGLLSSLKTLSKNVLSNSLMNILDTVVVHPVAAGIGLLHGGEKVTGRAALAGIGGMFQGSIEGLKNAPEAYRRGAPSDFAERTQSYWKPENKGFGRVLSAPMRVLSAQDQVFLDAAQNAEYFRMAHIKAAAEGLTGDEYKARVQDLLTNPTAKMEKQAVKYGQMMRFQDPMEFKGLEYVTRATKTDPLAIKIMKGFLRILFPFPRNSDRMFFAAIRNSPLGIIEPQNMRDFAAGGAKRDVAAARVLVGTGIAAGLYLWAANGGITGANPGDPAHKFMINLPGGVHVSYQGLADPFSTTIAGVATAVEDAKAGGKELGTTIFKSSTDLIGVLMDSTWATGASQLFQALDDQTGKALQSWVGRMASTFTTPALVREVNQDYIDPVVRNTKDNPIVDQVKAGMPELSKTLPAKHDEFGDVIKRENPLYLNIINPARIEKDKYSVAEDLSKVQSATPVVSKAPARVTVDGVKHKLTAQGQEKYQAASGRIFRQLMEENQGQLRALPNDQKLILVRQTLSEARKQARQELWGY